MTSEKPGVGYRSNPSEEHETTQELDAYGIWVKSEPQTIAESIPDVSDRFNFPEEQAGDPRPALKTAGNISLESGEPAGPPEPQDFIHSEKGEKGEAGLITDGLIPGVSRDDRPVDPVSRNDDLLEDLSKDIVIEVFTTPVPSLDAGAPPQGEAGPAEKEASAQGVPDTPVKPPEPSKDAHPAAVVQVLDSAEGLQLLKNILEELTVIRHEVSSFKELVSRRKSAAEPLEPKQEDEDEKNDEKVTITGDELTNIFHNSSHIPEALSPAAPFAQRIEVTLTDEEPAEAEEGIVDSTEPGQLQDAGPVYEMAPDTPEILTEDTREGPVQDDTANNQVLQGVYDEAPEHTWLNDTERNEAPPQVSPDEDGGNKEDSHDGLLPPHSAPASEDFLMDDLFIENGSMKDIPIELNPEDEEDIDHAFTMIESLIGPEAQDKAENPDEREPPDDTPPFDGPDRESAQGASPRGSPDLPEEEPSAFSSEPSVDKPCNLKEEVKNVLTFMDQLLESLPEKKIEEFAESPYFDIYKKLFNELGIA
ncbi:MAG: hypothetical protein LBU25_08470 [Treponema sp.]|jgi:hypothetical protein|nr:hypothetical protein [Treponema sp.]